MTAKRSGLGKGLGKGLDSLIPDNRSTKKSTPLKEKVEEPVLAGEKMNQTVWSFAATACTEKRGLL